MQIVLKEKGFYDGPVDGVFGARMRTGLIAFQRSQGFQATGQIDSQTVTALKVNVQQGTQPSATGQGGTQGARQSARHAATAASQSAARPAGRPAAFHERSVGTAACQPARHARRRSAPHERLRFRPNSNRLRRAAPPGSRAGRQNKLTVTHIGATWAPLPRGFFYCEERGLGEAAGWVVVVALAVGPLKGRGAS